jgi:hypothetical protein
MDDQQVIPKPNTATALDYDQGIIMITCSRNHTILVKAARVIEEEDGDVTFIFGSVADYCEVCENDPTHEGSSYMDWEWE